MLKDAGVNNVMITGDSLLTAINVAYNSNIISNSKNVWIGELNDLGDITWDYLENQEMRDRRKLSFSQDNDDSFLNSIPSKKRGFSMLVDIEELNQDNYTREQTLHIINRVQEGDCIIGLSGDCFQVLFKNFMNQKSNEGLEIILKYCKIYGRTSPDQKAFIVNCIKKMMAK